MGRSAGKLKAIRATENWALDSFQAESSSRFYHVLTFAVAFVICLFAAFLFLFTAVEHTEIEGLVKKKIGRVTVSRPTEFTLGKSYFTVGDNVTAGQKLATSQRYSDYQELKGIRLAMDRMKECIPLASCPDWDAAMAGLQDGAPWPPALVPSLSQLLALMNDARVFIDGREIESIKINELKNRLTNVLSSLTTIRKSRNPKSFATETKDLKTESEKISNEIRIAEKSRKSRRSDLEHRLQYHAQILSSAIFEFDSREVIRAPLEGRITSDQSPYAGQHFQMNETIFMIDPLSDAIHVELIVTGALIAKIKVGQQVLVAFESHPREANGSAVGKIVKISEAATSGSPFKAIVEIGANDAFLVKNLAEIKEGVRVEAKVRLREARLIDFVLEWLRKVAG